MLKSIIGTPAELSSLRIPLNQDCIVTLPASMENGQTFEFNFGDGEFKYKYLVKKTPGDNSEEHF
jgi:hypothetical protein